MKNLAVLAAGALILIAGPALSHAGVVVDEQQVVDQPTGNKVTRNRTVVIEGDKQKSVIDNGNRSVVTDLGKGTMTMIDATRKSYVEIPFPPKNGPMAGMGGVVPTVNFKKTGAHEKIIGYACDVYSGAGTVGGNKVNMDGCFSDSAPGAADFSGFQREMATKVKGTTMANMGQIPPGVPLRLSVATTVGNIPTSGMSPDQAAKLKQMLANRSFVTNTTVTKITPKTLPPDSFSVPSGYQKQQIPAMFGGPGRGVGPPPASAASPHKIPE